MTFDPNKALAIIFGASQWPNNEVLNSSSKVNPFQAAAQGMRDYFINSLQLPTENVLFDEAFDSPEEPAAMVRTMKAFLADKTKETEPNDADLFIYFVGHGAFAGNDYYLYIHSTGEERASQFDVEYLIDVIKPVTSKLRHCYIIIDACYSGGAYNVLSNIKKVRTLLLCSSSRDERSQGAMEEITRFTGALLTVLKQPHPSELSFAEVFSAGLEHITPTPEIHDINPRGSHASKVKVLRPYSTEHSSNPTPNPVPVKKGGVIVNKKLKWAIGIVLLGAVGIAGKVGYDSLFPLSPDHLLLQQLQASLQPQLGEQFSVSSTHYQENSRQRVVELSLAGLGLSTVPEVVWQFKQLRKLNLYNNRLETLPDAVGNLELLNELNLEKNQLRELPVSVGKLQLLERLDLRSNQLKELPTEVTAIGLGLKWQPQNESEKGIFLADNPLEVPPREKVEKGMERVELVGYLEKYPKEIRGIEKAIGKKLPLLDKVAWNSQGYRLNKANQVVELGLWNMGLSEVPTVVWQLRQLQTLYLDDNPLTALPAEIGLLKELEKLDLRNTHLTALPKEIVELQKLTFLNLWVNNLKQLPTEVEKLQQLRSLFLASNRLEQLPEGIWRLQNLVMLELRNNQLKELPKEIKQLQQLQWLYVGGNQVTQLPKAIGNLKNLQALDLSNNRLTELPQELVSLGLELKFEEPPEKGGGTGIFLGNNPLQVPPPEVIQQGREAVVKYFQERGK